MWFRLVDDYILFYTKGYIGVLGMGRLVVVGGAGFIGTRLCKMLAAESRDFVILDKQKSAAFPELTVTVDVRSREDLGGNLVEGDTLINLAAEHRDDVRPKSLYDDVNVGGAENICRVARENGVTKIIFTSSVAVYGFAAANTDESGEINYFNDYGRTKWEAEKLFRAWQQEDPAVRVLVVIRPTVVFGEQNRGNVYNLLRQIAAGRFVMVGAGVNKKSMAYVENVAAFISYSTNFTPGVHTYNYVDKPDFDMNTLVGVVRRSIGKSEGSPLRIPYLAGYSIGLGCDLLAKVAGRSLSISSIRIKKFCATTQFGSSVCDSGFSPPVTIEEGLQRTVKHEFLEDNSDEPLFYTE